MSNPQILAQPALSGAAIAAGQVLTIDSAALIPLIGETNQAGTVTVKPAGIALKSAAASGEDVACANGGECMALAGDTVNVGDILVAEYNTGRVIPFADSAYTDGTIAWTVGRALEAGADGKLIAIQVHITSRAIATAPA